MPRERQEREERAQRDRGRGQLRIEAIDGAPASESPHAPVFLEAGFRRGYRGLELDRSEVRARRAAG